MKYKPSVISLIDIIGFKALVNENPDPDYILNILETLKEFTKPDQDTARKYQKSFATFSDLSVRAISALSRLNKEAPIGIVSHELIDLLHIQLNLVNRGILIRGGMTFDNIHLSSSMVFGPGFNKAYYLESVKAIYPRIIVDNDLLELVKLFPLLKAGYHTVDEEITYIKDIIKKDKDGTWFIDYLKGAESETDDIYQNFDFLRKHKQVIIENYKKTRENKKANQKIIWLKTYHNKYIKNINGQTFMDYGLKKNEFIIFNKELSKKALDRMRDS